MSEEKRCQHGVRHPWQCDECDALDPMPPGYDPLAPKAPDWRLPYRTRDAGGSPEAAEAVAWAWLDGIAVKEAAERGGGDLLIESPALASDGRAVVLYRGTDLLAVATVFRDPMNFAILVRWLPPGSPHA